MHKVLITGGSGALGHYIIQELLQQEQIHILSLTRTARQSGHPRVTYRVADALDPSRLSEIIEQDRPDSAILSAWETTHGRYWTDPANHAWADATLHLAHTLSALPERHITFVGTCAEYEWGARWIEEGVTPERPNTLYGQQKLRASNGLMKLAEQNGLGVACARVFFPFSPLETENRITSVAIKSLLADRPLHLRAGDVYRDISHARTVARAIVALSLHQADGLFNISSGTPVHLGQFLRLIATAMGKPDLITWDMDTRPASEPYHLCGTGLKIKPYYPQNINLEAEIADFVTASADRFAEQNH